MYTVSAFHFENTYMSQNLLMKPRANASNQITTKMPPHLFNQGSTLYYLAADILVALVAECRMARQV